MLAHLGAVVNNKIQKGHTLSFLRCQEERQGAEHDPRPRPQHHQGDGHATLAMPPVQPMDPPHLRIQAAPLREPATAPVPCYHPVEQQESQ